MSTTTEKLIARRVSKGNNEAESATLLAEIMHGKQSDEQKIRDLVYRDFATEAQARAALATGE